ncbi:MAG: diguanylate cyclase, partial [Shimia sp.]
TAFFLVDHAGSMAEARAAVARDRPDLVLCEAVLPDGGAAELRQAIRADPGIAAADEVPVVALLPEDRAAARAGLLLAGLDDVISRPYDDATLQARIRHLLRDRRGWAELRRQAAATEAMGFAEPPAAFARPMRVAVIAETERQSRAWQGALRNALPWRFDVLDPKEVLPATVAGQPPDAYVMSVGGVTSRQRLDLISALGARPQARAAPILAVGGVSSVQMAATALDTGAGDAAPHGFEPSEVAERLARLLRRRDEAERLHRALEAGLEAAVTDPLTGLHNRRYARTALARLEAAARRRGAPFAVMLLDLDHFKAINDRHGHAVGDRVLIDFAALLRGGTRSQDVVARIGGEEFLVAMPDTTLDEAAEAADRLCAETRGTRFADGVALSVSVGLALAGDAEALDHDTLLERADAALYDAKAKGRDCVTVSRSAA